MNRTAAEVFLCLSAGFLVAWLPAQSSSSPTAEVASPDTPAAATSAPSTSAAPVRDEAELRSAITTAEARLDLARTLLAPVLPPTFDALPPEVRPDSLQPLVDALPEYLASVPNPRRREFVEMDCSEPPCILVFEEALDPIPDLSREERNARFAERRAFEKALREQLKPMAAWGPIHAMTHGQHPVQGRTTVYLWASPEDDPHLATRLKFQVDQRLAE